MSEYDVVVVGAGNAAMCAALAAREHGPIDRSRDQDHPRLGFLSYGNALAFRLIQHTLAPDDGDRSR